MEITFIGVFQIVLGLMILLRGSLRSAFLFFVMTGVFGGSAAILLPALGGSSVPPFQIALGFVLLVIVAPGSDFRSALPAAFRANVWLAIFVGYGIIAAVVAPRLFARELQVAPMRPIEGGSLFETVALAPTSQNLTSAFYLLGTLLTAVASYVLVRHCRGGTKTLVRAAVAVGWAHVILGIAVALTQGSVVGSYFEVLRNANYAQLNQEYQSFARIRGLFPEPSGYAEFGFAWFVLNAELWYRSISWRATGAVALALAAVLFFSTSSTAYVGLAGYLAWFTLRILFVRSAANGARLAQFGAAALALAVLAALALTFVPELSTRFLQVLRDMTVDKSTSESALQRLFWAQQGWNAFIASWGLGIGPGSFRSSSLLTAVMGSVGVIGIVSFALYALRVFQPGRLSTYGRGPRIELSIGGALAAAALLSQIPAAVSSAKPDPGSTFAIFAGAAIGLRPRRRPVAQDSERLRSAGHEIDASLARPDRRVAGSC